MPHRLKFVVSYDGLPFAGWQSQANKQAVQDYLERAFHVVTGNPVRVHGAERTDAGVHALAQVAHVDLADRALAAWQWPAALNTSLPPSIRVLRCGYVRDTFHARFSARGKLYRYRIFNDSILPPFEAGRAWHIPGELNFQGMLKEAEAFLGRHDFASFAANRGKTEQDTWRTMDSVSVRRAGKRITIEISGDGFLYKMVRLMVGALVRYGRGQAAAGDIQNRLERPAHTSGAARLAAPAAGLFLARIRY